MAFGRVKLKPKRGTAILPVKVSAAGRVALRGQGRIKPRARLPRGPATVRLKITPRGKALETLRRKRKVTVTARVVYRPAGQSRITGKKRIKLKLKRGKS